MHFLNHHLKQRIGNQTRILLLSPAGSKIPVSIGIHTQRRRKQPSNENYVFMGTAAFLRMTPPVQLCQPLTIQHQPARLLKTGQRRYLDLPITDTALRDLGLIRPTGRFPSPSNAQQPKFLKSQIINRLRRISCLLLCLMSPPRAFANTTWLKKLLRT
jgi:hypothetical protein